LTLLRKLRKLYRLLLDPFYRKALARGVAAATEHEPVLRGLRCALIVDVGANKGQFALVARRHCPEARIVSFEPLPEPAAKFRNLFSADAGVVLHSVAIGAEARQATMHVSHRDDSSSLLPITETQTSVFPGTGERTITQVEIVSLDAVVPDLVRPNLLKVDVQGYELEVLQGCGRLLDRIDYAYIECSFLELYRGQALADQVIRFLQASGFRLEGIYNLFYNPKGKPVQGDFFFVRSTDAV
jgi:FkbM family methyltransferase